MYTKTATAVVLALLGGAKAGDAASQPTDATTLESFANLYKHECNKDVTLALNGGGGKAPANPPANPITDAYTCYAEAAVQSATEAEKAKKFCVQYVTASKACTMHEGYEVKAAEVTTATSVYMLAGKYQDDAAVKAAAVGGSGGGAGGDDGKKGAKKAVKMVTWDGTNDRVCECLTKEDVLDKDGKKVMVDGKAKQ